MTDIQKTKKDGTRDIAIPQGVRWSDHSEPDGWMKRLRLHFDNGVILRIVQGPCSHGGDEGLFEIAIMDHPPRAKWVYDKFRDTAHGDSVLGHLTADDVNEWISRIMEAT